MIDKQTAKLVARIAENLPAMDSDTMQRWIDDPKGLQEFLKKLTLGSFKVFKTLKLGTDPRTADQFREAFKDGGFKISDWADDILGKTSLTTKETDAELVVMSVGELGFKNGAKRKDIYKRALSLGLELCPAEVGPQLRLQYKDQPNGEWLLIAMEPIADSGGDLDVFGVRRDDYDFWLNSYDGHPDNVWDAGPRWVFCRHK